MIIIATTFKETIELLKNKKKITDMVGITTEKKVLTHTKEFERLKTRIIENYNAKKGFSKRK